MATIMIIEDDPHTARLLEATLQNLGYEVCVAPNALQGLRTISLRAPDLLLLDLMLPGLDGFEVLSRLRADPETANLPVVVVSAKSRVVDQQTARELGANSYLVKPYDPVELRATIRSLLHQQIGE